jgi:hypothetical protein
MTSGKEPKVSVMSMNKQQHALQFVLAILHPEGNDLWRCGWKSFQVRFHNLLKQLWDECGFDAPHDHWETCLPAKSMECYELAPLLLMLCSVLIPDERLVTVMHSLFSSYEVTPEFILEKYAADPLFWETILCDLGLEVLNTKNVILAVMTTLGLGQVPRNYTKIVVNYKGVGPKMALVTVHSSYDDVVS